MLAVGKCNRTVFLKKEGMMEKQNHFYYQSQAIKKHKLTIIEAKKTILFCLQKGKDLFVKANLTRNKYRCVCERKRQRMPEMELLHS